MNRRLIFLIVLAVVTFAAVLIIQQTNIGSNLIWRASDGGNFLLPLVTVAALIDSVNPCAFSILLLTIAFLFSVGNLREKVLGIGFFYILGIFIVYMLIGLGILQALHLFNTPHFMAKVGAALLVAFGLINVISEVFPRFPIKLAIPHSAHSKMASLMEKGSVPTAFLLGALVGLCEFPCTGGPYLMVLGLLHDNPTYLLGLGYLLLYNLIFVLPLAIILFIASDKALVEKVRVWQKEHRRPMRLWTGLAMIFLGLIIFLI